MHKNDLEMVESGIVPTKTRKYRPFLVRILSPLFLLFFRSTISDQKNNFEPFEPDIIIDENDFDLGQYGFNATVMHIPGHSDGSVGVLTESHSFFSGDIFVNFNDKPAFNSGMADKSFEDLDRSIGRVKGLNVQTVFPGHGDPFTRDELHM